MKTFWRIKDSKNRRRGRLIVRDCVVVQSTLRNNYMKGWGEDQVENWLDSANWQFTVKVV